MSTFTGYPEQASLRGDLVVILRSAVKSKPDMADRENIGIAWGAPWQTIDRPTHRHLGHLNARLARHVNFEYMNEKELEEALLSAISTYRGLSPKPNIREFAGEVLSGMAKPARALVFYLGVNHLKVKSSFTIGEVEILTKAQAKRAIDNNRWPSAFNSSPSFARVTTSGTNSQARLQRARFAVQEALGEARLVIQEELGRMGGIREQWLFDLNGAWAARYGARWSSGLAGGDSLNQSFWRCRTMRDGASRSRALTIRSPWYQRGSVLAVEPRSAGSMPRPERATGVSRSQWCTAQWRRSSSRKRPA